MLHQVVFQNKGVIDPRSIKTFGVSSKDCPNPIGFFGTGLKYAIAVLVRTGHTVTIWAGTQKLEFGVSPVKIRNDDFQLITMNGEELGFTTELGKKWEMWQAFRELYCNTLDEGGRTFEEAVPEANDNETIIAVTGQLFSEQFRNKQAVFLEKDSMVRVRLVDIHQGTSKVMYYRKVRVRDLKQASLYTYNLNDLIDLTEDRTCKYDWQADHQILDAICQSEDPGFIEDCVTAKDVWYEHRLLMNDYGLEPSETFMTTVSAINRERKNDLNHGAWKIYNKFRKRSALDEDYVKLTAIEQKQLDKAIDFAKKMDFPVNSYPIHTVEYLGEGTKAMAISEIGDKRILLSRGLFMTGSQHVCRALIEEFIHLKYGLDDCSREMQNFLFERVMHYGAQTIGEAL